MINHLWQSTVFVILAGLLTLAFRRDRAQVRYGLWFCASLKFLLPFSLLLTLGGYLARSRAARNTAAPAFAVTVEEFAEPFTFVSSPPLPATLPPPRRVDWAPRVAIAIWALGFVGILLIRLRGWLRIRAAVQSSIPMDIPCAVEVRSSSALIEPGVVGFFRPVLLLPAGIAQRLTPDQLQAVVKHELCHVERQDNLTAAVHMLIEAVFWFHPFVWWISARLVEERERACDEAVLESGNDRQGYAESILKTCQFCVESPLACVSGVMNANLKRRIVHIMTQPLMHKLSFGKNLLLAASGIAVVTLPVLWGVLTAPLTRAQSGQAAGAQPALDYDVGQRTAMASGPAFSGGVFVTPIPGAPFSAVARQEMTQILADGSVFERKTSALIARDSQGRIRNERHQVIPASSPQDPLVLSIHLYDPNTRVSVFLNPYRHIAQHMILPDAPSTVPPADWAQLQPENVHLPPGVREDDLGTSVIDGLDAHGYRRTVTVSEKVSATGRPLNVVDEYWYSEELRLNLVTKHSDPRTGSLVMTVQNVNMNEPPVEWFDVPPDYKVVDMTTPEPAPSANTPRVVR